MGAGASNLETSFDGSPLSSSSSSSSSISALSRVEEKKTQQTAASPSLSASSSASASSTSTSLVLSSAYQRNLARRTLEAVRSSASSISHSLYCKSAMVRFSVDTIHDLIFRPMRSFTMGTWDTYGDPLISQLDEKLDRAIAAIEVAAEQRERELERLRIRSQFQPHSQEQQYAQKWTELKEKLSNSRWFQVVNDILLQNPLMQSVKSRYVKPAEAFFNTATEVYMTHGGSFEQFVEEMKLKMGDAWDERLANHAYAFHSTCRLCKAMVGAGWFFGGALQLGKNQLNIAVDSLIARWESVVAYTDNAVDIWLPEQTSAADATANDQEEKKICESCCTSPPTTDTLSLAGDLSDEDDDQLVSVQEEDREAIQEALFADAIVRSPSPKGETSAGATSSSAAGPPQEKPQWRPLASKISARLRQRVQLMLELPEHIRSKLLESAWFTRVDEILDQNDVVQLVHREVNGAVARASNLASTLTRPAVKFYDTAVQSFWTHAKSCEDFIACVKEKMGPAWDDRLRDFAVLFFHTQVKAHGQAQDE